MFIIWSYSQPAPPKSNRLLSLEWLPLFIFVFAIQPLSNKCLFNARVVYLVAKQRRDEEMKVGQSSGEGILSNRGMDD